tara:strand:+ start:2091 stop:2897 length:807 start_codon:yes stop_codon:yes gene_type:complete
MVNDDGSIDWLNMSAAERIAPTKALYAVLGVIAKNMGINIESHITMALGDVTERGADYASNFRKGKIAAAKALTIHRYLEENHFHWGQIVAPELFQVNPKSAWENFVETKAQSGMLKIHRSKFVKPSRDHESSDEEVKYIIAEFGMRSKYIQKPDATIRLGQDYWFELQSNIDGYCVAFESCFEEWQSIPLGSDERRLRVKVGQGTQFLPRDAQGNPIELVEIDHGGTHRFVFIVSPDRNLTTGKREILKFYATNSDVEVHIITVRFV